MNKTPAPPDISNREFYKKLFSLALPIAVQQLMAAGLYFVDNIMIGGLGETPLGAVGLANQLAFLFFMALIGVTSGGGVFVAQLWGKKDLPQIKRIQGIVLICALCVAALCVAVGTFIPQRFIDIFSDDPQVISQGASYLRIACWGYLFQAVTFTFSSVLKNCNIIVLPVVSSAVALVSNTCLNYCLIFGKFGAPALGVRGAAIATVISLFLDALIITVFSFVKKHPAAATPKQLFDPQKGLFKSYVRICAPVLLNEFGWGGAMVVYTFIYGMLGTGTVAAMQIVNTVDRLSYITLIALGTAAGIMVGNLIGEGRIDAVKRVCRRFMLLMAGLGLVAAALVIGLGPVIVRFYNVSQATRQIAVGVITVLGAGILINSQVFLNIVGILRAGGDTVFATCSELIPMWTINLPVFFLTAIVLGQPIWLAYALTLTGDAVKLALTARRFFSNKWIKDVTVMEV